MSGVRKTEPLGVLFEVGCGSTELGVTGGSALLALFLPFLFGLADFGDSLFVPHDRTDSALPGEQRIKALDRALLNVPPLDLEHRLGAGTCRTGVIPKLGRFATEHGV